MQHRVPDPAAVASTDREPERLLSPAEIAALRPPLETPVRQRRAAEPRWRQWQRLLTDWLRELGELVAPSVAEEATPPAEPRETIPPVRSSCSTPRDAAPRRPTPPGRGFRAGEEERRVTEEQRRLREWNELRAMMDRRTLADAAPRRHPRWRLYPAGRSDHARLLEVPGVDAALAELLMETYGALDVLCEDVPDGIEERTGGALPAARAAALLRSLRASGSIPWHRLHGPASDPRAPS